MGRGPQAGKEFWATRVAAAVVEVDVDKESVSAKEVEGIGLNAPKDKAEALERFRHNLVVYRQNYAVAVWFCALLSNLTNPLAVVALLSAAGAVACASDVLLGELSLATNDTLTWNKTRAPVWTAPARARSAVASVAVRGDDVLLRRGRHLRNRVGRVSRHIPLAIFAPSTSSRR